MTDDILTRDTDGNLAVRTVSSTGDNYVNPDDVYTRDSDGNLCVRVTGQGGGGDQHNLGYFATQAALEEAYPTAEAGDWAIVGATDTVWIWDTDTSAWKDSDQKGQVTSVNGQTGDVVLDLLPSQTGNAGKFLTTDGTDASWSNKPLVNNSSGSNGLNIGNGTYSTNSTNSVAIGNNAQDGAYSVIIGVDARSFGYGSKSNVAIGYNSYIGGNSNCIAIGDSAKTGANNAIQLNASGSSQTNSDANTVKIANANGNFEIMSADGTIPEARLADTTNAQQGDVLTLDVNGDAVWQAGGSSGGLPSQTGNAGKFLTTDGTDASWGTTVDENVLDIKNTASGLYSDQLQMRLYAPYNNTDGTPVEIYANHSGICTISGVSLSLGSIRTTSTGKDIGSLGYPFRRIYVNNIFNGADITIPTTGGTMAVVNTPSTMPTLAVADWSNNTQTVNVTGVTATNTVFVSPAPASAADYASAGIVCTAQGNGTLSFTCTTTPTNAITVNVVCL